MENKGKTLGNGTHVYHLCCLFTFYFDFFAFPLSLDNETNTGQFHSSFYKTQFSFLVFLHLLLCIGSEPPRECWKAGRHTPNPLVFCFFFLEVSAKRNNVTDIEFCFQKENLRGLENGGLNQGDCPVWARQGPPHFLLLFSPLLSVCLLSTVGA